MSNQRYTPEFKDEGVRQVLGYLRTCLICLSASQAPILVEGCWKSPSNIPAGTVTFLRKLRDWGALDPQTRQNAL